MSAGLAILCWRMIVVVLFDTESTPIGHGSLDILVD